eukprot:2191223-Amphidinium_carterae.1
MEHQLRLEPHEVVRHQELVAISRSAVLCRLNGSDGPQTAASSSESMSVWKANFTFLPLCLRFEVVSFWRSRAPTGAISAADGLR